MLKRLISYTMLVIVTVLLTSIFQPLLYVQGFAQGDCHTFPETGKTVCGRFWQYWQQHGGLAQQGYPISGEFTEISDLNDQAYTVQYFERAVFEKHPENAPPNDVLLSQLGTFQFKAKYPSGEPSGGSPPPTPPVQPTQPPVSNDVTVSGNEAIKTAPFTLPAGNYQVVWSAQNNSTYSQNLIIELYTVAGGSVDLLVNQITQAGEQKSGSTFLYNIRAGQYYLDVLAHDTNWSVTFKKQ
jgi:hypothetical protein